MASPSPNCRRPHLLICLSHAEVIAGKLQPCDVCSPLLPDVQGMVKAEKPQMHRGVPILIRTRPTTPAES